MSKRATPPRSSPQRKVWKFPPPSRCGMQMRVTLPKLRREILLQSFGLRASQTQKPPDPAARRTEEDLNPGRMMEMFRKHRNQKSAQTHPKGGEKAKDQSSAAKIRANVTHLSEKCHVTRAPSLENRSPNISIDARAVQRQSIDTEKSALTGGISSSQSVPP